jgi:hypothetical protein
LRLALTPVALFAVVGISAGCPGAHHDPPADVHTTPEAVLELARDYVSEGPGTAVIEARASQYSDQGGLKGKLLLIARRPGHLRMEGLSPTDDSVSVLATDGERFTSYQRGANHCFVGRACPDNVGRFASVPLAADDLVGVLLGRPPIIPHDSATMKWDGEVGAYRLELVGSSAGLGAAHGKIQRLWVRHGDGRIVRTTLSVGGKTKVAAVVVLAVMVGLTDEAIQSRTPGRDPSLGDIGKDAAGATLAALLWRSRTREVPPA